MRATLYNMEISIVHISSSCAQLDEREQTIREVEDKLAKAQIDLDAAKEQVTLLDKKYNKAKKLIKEFQQR